MNVTRWMTRNLITCRPTDSLQRAAQLLWDHDLGALPVVDDAGRLVGMITDRDVCMAVFTRGSHLAAHSVGSAMARLLFTLSVADSLESAHELMRSQQLRRLPVVDAGGTLVGLLSVHDVARRTLAEGGERARRAACMEVVRTLAAITEPRPVSAADESGIVEPVTAELAATTVVIEPVRPPATRSTVKKKAKSPARSAGTPRARAGASGARSSSGATRSSSSDGGESARTPSSRSSSSAGRTRRSGARTVAKRALARNR